MPFQVLEDFEAVTAIWKLKIMTPCHMTRSFEPFCRWASPLFSISNTIVQVFVCLVILSSLAFFIFTFGVKPLFGAALSTYTPT